LNADIPPDDADRELQRRFARLFEGFAASSIAAVTSDEAAFLLNQLQPPAGAHVLCCDRSLREYGWALTTAGCSVRPLIGPSEPDASESAVCAAEVLTTDGTAAPRRTLALLGARLSAGARLVVSGISDPTAVSMLLPASLFTPLASTVSSGGLRVSVWVRADS
jgi:hypothetical protein